jgi:SAM-dependent methyltransferase
MSSPAAIEQHYEQLLAARYTWMMGGIERCLADARGLIDAAGISCDPSCPAILDLGCGPGYHARALAERGCRVIAVDVSAACLGELRRGCAGLDVVPVHADVLNAAAYDKYGPFAALLCVGDTLAHLEDKDCVARLLDIAARVLAPDGALVLEYREQPQELAAREAVLTLRADHDRIMQCILHFQPDRIWVTDVVYEWRGESWECSKSSYPKLRLSSDDSDEIVRQAAGRGLPLQSSTTRAGRRVLILKKQR